MDRLRPRLLACALCVAAGFLIRPVALIGQHPPGEEADAGSDALQTAGREGDAVAPRDTTDVEKGPAGPGSIIAAPFRIMARGIGEAGAFLMGLAGKAGGEERSKPSLFRPIVGAIGPGSGIGAGAAFRPLPLVDVEAALSVQGAQRLSVGYGKPGGMEGSPGAAEGNRRPWLEARWSRDPDLRFWGVGPETAAGLQSDYRLDRLEVIAGRELRLGSGLELDLEAAWERTRVGRGLDEDYPDVRTTFAGTRLTGLADESEFLRVAATAGLDRSTGSGVRRRGIRIAGRATAFLPLEGGETSVLRWESDAAGYVPLGSAHGLAVRTFLEVNRGGMAAEIPFTHLASVGSTRGLRGFPRDRFRDRDAAGLMAEWRHELWREGVFSVEGFLFLDAAGVSPSLSALEQLHASYGGGFRFLRLDDLEAMAYVALTGDRPGLGVRFDWPF